MDASASQLRSDRDVDPPTIRPRRAGDMASCVALLRAVHQADRYPSVWPDDPASWLAPRGLVGAWVAVREPLIVGHVALGNADRDVAELAASFAESNGDVVELKRLFVAPTERGGGIGNALLDVAIAHAELHGLTAVLEVTADREDAIRLYERSGWYRIASYPAHWRRSSGSRPLAHLYRSPSLVQGTRVTLRRARSTDLDMLASWFSRRDFVAWWGAVPRSREEVERDCVRPDPTRDPFIVEADGRPIGYIQSWSESPNEAGIDIVLVPEAHGHGYGPDAVRALALHLRERGFSRVIVDPLRSNARGIAAFRRAGFVPEHEQGDHLIMLFQPVAPA